MMSLKPFDKSAIRNILVISLTNIGDVILTFPVIDTVMQDFPQSKISLVIGPKAESFFSRHPRFEKVYVFNKRQPFKDTWRFLMQLRRERFDLVIDLRNTAVPLILGAKISTPIFARKKSKGHMKEKHMRHLRTVYPQAQYSAQRMSLEIPAEKRDRITKLLNDGKIVGKFAVIAPGAANESKRWSQEGFAQVADYLFAQHGVSVVFVGDQGDAAIAADVIRQMTSPSLNLCGQINLLELAEILKRAALVVSNDSAPMHLASYFDVPVVALFGVTDPTKYGPWGRRGAFIQKYNADAAQALPPGDDRPVILQITVEDVIRSIKSMNVTAT